VTRTSSGGTDPVPEKGASVAPADDLVRTREASASRQNADDALETASLLLEAAQALSAHVTLDSALEAIVSVVAGLTGRKGVIIDLLDNETDTLTVARSTRPRLKPGSTFPLSTVSPDAAACVRDRRPLLIDYSRADLPDPVRERALRLRTRLMLAVPLVASDHVIGLMLVDEPGSDRPFSSREVAVATGIAPLAALAISNARLFEAEAVSLSRIQALHELGELAASSLEPAEVADHTLRYLTEKMGVDVATLWSADDTGDRLFPVAGTGFPPEFFEAFSSGVDITEDLEVVTAFREDRVVAREASDIAKVPRRVRNAYKRFGVPLASLLVLPLRARSSRFGAITLAWTHPHVLDQDEIDFFASGVRSLAIAMENARLFALERTRLRLAEALTEVDRAVHASHEFDEIAQCALESGAAAIGAETGAIIGRDGDRWLTWNSFNFDPPVVGVGLTDEENPHGVAALASGAPVAVDDAYNDPRVNGDYMRHYGLRSVIVSPIIIRGAPVAGLYFNYNEAMHHFTTAEVDFAAKVASSLSLALENARLFESAQRRLARTGLLQDVTAAAAGSLSVDEICARALERLQEMPDLVAGAFYSLDDSREVLHSRALFGYPEDVIPAVRDVPVDDASNPGRLIKHDLRLLTHEHAGSPRASGARFARMGLHDLRWIMLPIRSADATIGALALIFRGSRPFPPSEIDLLRSVSDIVGAAMANAQLYEELFVSRARVRSILESITDGFYALDKQWCFNYANTEIGRMLGQDPVRLMGRPIDDALGAAAAAEFRSVFGPAMHEGRSIVHEQLVGSSGRWVETHAYPSTDGIAVYSRDITERRRAEQALAESRERIELLGTLLEDSSQPFMVGAMDGSLMLFNKAFQEITGYNARQLSEKRWPDDLTTPETLPLEKSIVEAMACDGVPRRYEKEFLRADGKRVPVEVLRHVRRDEQGRVDFYYAFFTDITERRKAQEAADTELQRLREIIDDIPLGVSLVDADGSVLVNNLATATIWGGTLPKAASPDEFEMYAGFHRGTGRPVQADEWPAVRTLVTGQRVEKIFDILRFDGTRVPVRITTTPVRDAAGMLTRVVVVTEDVSAQIEREKLAEALSAIGVAVSSTLDIDKILHRVITLSAEALSAEAATVSLRESGEWVVREAYGLPEPNAGTVLAEDEARVMALASREYRPIAVDDAEHDDRLDPDTVRRLRFRSLLSIPLIAQGRVLGNLSFHHHAAKHHFTDAQIDFATKLMSIVALALSNARLYERERHIADTLQQAVLSPPQAIEGTSVAYLYRPASKAADVGGDFYDVFRIDQHHVGVVVGDVSGKGVEAARLTSLIRDGIRAYAYVQPEVTWVLGRVNEFVLRNTPVEEYATVFFAILDLATGEMDYCGAGHPSAFVIREDGGVEALSSVSPIVGAFEGAQFVATRSDLKGGDTLVSYTDGITEARRENKLFGEARVAKTLAGLSGVEVERLPQAILGDVLAFSQGTLRDDVVILAVALDREH
jgi:PAS domain S-box-containing protein